ncbi:MAG: hypothetical protein JSW47_22575 [Phycisphaerales bacterium]|nr:MAG: hypothetical protein JSW47_22575 [Phycisphaerales bacterium]
MHRLLILTSLLIFILSGCGLRPNNCYEQCYATMNAMPGPIDGQVEYFGIQDDLEKVRMESFSDCIIVGKSHFCGPAVPLKVLKRFAAKKGANVILWRWTLDRAGLLHDCQCNPIGSHHVEIDDAPGENEIVFVSASASVRGSAASGPGATLIYSHQIWFLYRDEQKQ